MHKPMVTILLSLGLVMTGAAEAQNQTVRVATFNASLNRSEAGGLIASLSTRDDTQIERVAETIQRVNPDILLINEFDFDADGQALDLFREAFLAVGQNGAPSVVYPHAFAAPSNTGVPTGVDLDRDGGSNGPGDAQGFGFFPGQFGMALLSKFPIDEDAVRTFQRFLWRDMPDALLPTDPETGDGWYGEEALDVLRLSSKSHWDVPVNIGGRRLESVRRLYVGLQSFRSMSRMDASLMKASALRLRFSQSLASRRQRLSQAMVRSTTQRLGWTTKPFTRSDRLTISVSRSGRMPARAR